MAERNTEKSNEERKKALTENLLYFGKPIRSLISEYVDGPLYTEQEMHRYTMLPARFRHDRRYDGNPLICSLPEMPDMMNELLIRDQVQVPDNVIRENLDDIERIEELEGIFRLRLYLPFYSDVAKAIFESMRASYAKRTLFACPTPEQELARRARSRLEERCRTDGFSLIGVSGTGKTSAVTEVLRHLPISLLATYNDGTRQVQIPVIYVTAPPHSNIGALCIKIAEEIDYATESGDRHKREIMTERNVGNRLVMVKNYIEAYCVGCIIIDEIQFMEFGTDTSRSFDQFLSLSEDTGVAIGLIGTEEAISKVNTKARTAVRFNSKYQIRADAYYDDNQWLTYAVDSIWQYQWTKNFTPITPALRDQLIKYSSGNIALITLIFYLAQLQIIETDDGEGTITSNLLEKVYKENIKTLHSLVKQGKDCETDFEQAFKDAGKITASLKEALRERQDEADKKRCMQAITGDVQQKIATIIRSAISVTGCSETEAREVLRTVMAEVDIQAVSDTRVVAMMEKKIKSERNKKQIGPKASSYDYDPDIDEMILGAKQS